jgi:folate-binding protein YgfZ
MATAESPLNPSDAAFFDLSERAKLRVTGQDRHRYLNGQITNDLRKATETEAIAACVLNAKGKMDAHVFVSVMGDGFMLDAEMELRESLQPRLERYVIADDVVLEDVTERLSIFHLIGASAPDLPKTRIVSANRFGVPGWDIWMEIAQRDEAFDRLTAIAPFCEQDRAEVFRIEQGIARWGRELSGDILPPEANLEATCIDYEKGCYIGQEVISRMKMSGQRSKSLCGMRLLGEPEIHAGMRLVSDEAKEVGWITSATRSERLGASIALGYAKRGSNAVGTQLTVIEMDAPVARAVIVDLPFTSERSGIG